MILCLYWVLCLFFFFFNDTATTEIYTNLSTLSLHDALPISPRRQTPPPRRRRRRRVRSPRSEEHTSELQSHSEISYAVFCLKKKKKNKNIKKETSSFGSSLGGKLRKDE